jgi:hypothetical protein
MVQAEVLILEEFRKNDVLHAWNINEGDLIELKFIHSLYKVPQSEKFYISNFKMVLFEVIFGSYDAALYYNEDPSGGIKKRNKEYYIDKEEYFSEINFVLASIFKHELYVNNEFFDLYSVASKGSFLRLFLNIKINSD